MGCWQLWGKWGFPAGIAFTRVMRECTLNIIYTEESRSYPWQRAREHKVTFLMAATGIKGRLEWKAGVGKAQLKFVVDKQTHLVGWGRSWWQVMVGMRSCYTTSAALPGSHQSRLACGDADSEVPPAVAGGSPAREEISAASRVENSSCSSFPDVSKIKRKMCKCTERATLKDW